MLNKSVIIIKLNYLFRKNAYVFFMILLLTNINQDLARNISPTTQPTTTLPPATVASFLVPWEMLLWFQMWKFQIQIRGWYLEYSSKHCAVMNVTGLVYTWALIQVIAWCRRALELGYFRRNSNQILVKLWWPVASFSIVKFVQAVCSCALC